MVGRRSALRARVHKSGKIITSTNAPPIHCTIRNLSRISALLIVGSGTFGIPRQFDLVIGESSRRGCRITRRMLDSLHVQFQ